jgi:hypothetical protein
MKALEAMPEKKRLSQFVHVASQVKKRVSSKNRITYANLETLNQDHRMLTQGVQED